MPPGERALVGERIAYYRKLRKLTQRDAADLAFMSYSLWTKVEQGHMVPSKAFLASAARVLQISVSELNGQPYYAELEIDEIDSLVQGVRDALDGYDLGPDDRVRPRETLVLHAEAEDLCAQVRKTNIKSVAVRLPDLINEATTAAYLTPDSALWKILASLYRTAYDVTSKLGFSDLSMVALDRMQWTAERASDPVLAATRQYYRTLAYTRSGRMDTSRLLIASGIELAAGAPAGRERDVVYGQLHLGAAVVAARSKDGDLALEYLAEASRIASETGPAETVHWLSFGPANCGVHKVSVLTDLERYSEAVAEARGLAIPSGWAVSRHAAHVTEVAQAQLMIGRDDAALRNLSQARQLAPQQTRYSPGLRATLGVLVKQQRTPTRELAGLAKWAGVGI
ncbi:helix-turn-helix domain-containing protein [Kitasatospora griseola]|uniref:helix-turn-helix domain-containing protein n=1 Tax=Kitasatospora griseola TaxID=2064 RepID=UPI0034456675